MELNTMTVLWAVLFLVAVFIEAQTMELVAVWFLPGILSALLLSLFGIYGWIQFTVFVVESAVMLFLALKIFRKRILKNISKEKTDTDLLIGRDAKVEEDIDNLEMSGAVKIDGRIWSARMTDDGEKAVRGEFVTVESISGVKLICKRK